MLLLNLKNVDAFWNFYADQLGEPDIVLASVPLYALQRMVMTFGISDLYYRPKNIVRLRDENHSVILDMMKKVGGSI